VLRKDIARLRTVLQERKNTSARTSAAAR
jgi:ribosomal protein L29